MIFLDSWIFIEYFSKKDNKECIRIMEDKSVKLITTTVLLEVKYRLTKLFDLERANYAMQIIEGLDNLKIMPVTKEIADLACDLRLKYYSDKRRDLSYIDTINLATSIITGCDKFYTGDKDFNGINEIEVVSIR
ncbi:MAG: PIN domain-containing protein [Candidatus Aenigmarchaeota archaeon]|nr:PIN domain-containing protein [Candidatus Aenigmarchaeota archaeon]